MPERSTAESPPEPLRPYIFHRLELAWQGKSEAIGDCPFCGGDRKFHVSPKNGMHDCKTCEVHGNIYTFLRELHQQSVESTKLEHLELVAEERKVSAKTLQLWGLAQSIIDNEWILPAYGLKQEINNLYRWSKVKQKDDTYKRRLLTTATLQHYLFGYQFWEEEKKDVWLTEGPWDGMCLWEALSRHKVSGNKLQRTLDASQAIIETANVLSVPGCETFRDEWVAIFKGKNVHLLYDNDHPRVNKKTGKVMPPAGHVGMKQAARKLRKTARSIKILYWGENGYDETLPDGHDVRDFLNSEEVAG